MTCGAAARLRRNVGWDIFLALAVVAIVGMLGILSPPYGRSATGSSSPRSVNRHSNSESSLIWMMPAKPMESHVKKRQRRSDTRRYGSVVERSSPRRGFTVGVKNLARAPIGITAALAGGGRGALANAPPNRTPASPPYIGVRRYGRIELLPLDELVYVVASDKYTELVLAGGERTFCDQSLGSIQAALPPSFVRIHKSYLVRFSLVGRLIVKRGARYFAELKTGERLPIGRSRYRAVKSRLVLPYVKR